MYATSQICFIWVLLKSIFDVSNNKPKHKTRKDLKEKCIMISSLHLIAFDSFNLIVYGSNLKYANGLP